MKNCFIEGKENHDGKIDFFEKSQQENISLDLQLQNLGKIIKKKSFLKERFKEKIKNILPNCQKKG
jgi:hypothetical protein